ncbi:hypothetical protein SAMN04487777_12730, partial [Priestia aryabhattai B8W22]
ATGITGATGATGITGASQPAESSLFFNQSSTSTPISVGVETTLSTITLAITAGNEVKIDNNTQILFVTSSNWSISYNINLRRDGTLINQLTISRNGNSAGDQRFLSANTYVDAPPSSGNSTYTISVHTTVASNVTSIAAEVRGMNIIRFI